MDELPEWVARFIAGPYDGAEVVVIAVADFVAVKRVREAGGRRRLSVIGNPCPTPTGYELYRLESFDDETITYVYGEADFRPYDDQTSASLTRDMEYA